MDPKMKAEKMKVIETQLTKLEAHLSFGQREQATNTPLAINDESDYTSNPSSSSALTSPSCGSDRSHYQRAYEEVKEDATHFSSSTAAVKPSRLSTAKRTLQYERALERKSKQLDELVLSEGNSPEKQAKIAELKKEVIRAQRNVVLRAEMFPETADGGDGEEEYTLSAWANGLDPKASTDHISSKKKSGSEKTQERASRHIQSYQTKLESLDEIHRSRQKSHQQGPGTKGTYGPDGANLFVYGIPETYGENDLESMFTQFGHIIHTKVFRDPKTGTSKGFGFISYDTLPPAQQACQHMNGFLLAGRRLQVKPKDVNGPSSSASSNTQSLNDIPQKDDFEGSDVHEFILPPNSHMSSAQVNSALKWLKEKYPHVRDIKIKSQPPPGKGYSLSVYVGGKHPEQATSVHGELIGIIDSMTKKLRSKSQGGSPSFNAPQPLLLSGAANASSSTSVAGSNGSVVKSGLPFYDAIIPQNEFMADNGIITAIQRSKKRYADRGVGEVKILSPPVSLGRKGHIIRVIMTDHESTMYRSVWQEIVDALIAIIKHMPSHRLNGESWSELVKMFKPQPVPSTNNSPNHAPGPTPIASMANSSHFVSKSAASLSMAELNLAGDSGGVKQRKSLMIFDPSTSKPIDFSDQKSTPVQVGPANASSKLGPIVHEMFISANEFMYTPRMKDAIASSIQRHSKDGVRDVQVMPSKDGHIVRVFVSNKESKLYKSVWQEVADTVIQSIKDTPSHRLYSLKPSTLVKIFKPQPQLSEMKPVGDVDQTKSSPVKEVAKGSKSTMNSAVPTKLPLRWLSQRQPSILPVPKASTVIPTTNSNMVSKGSDDPTIPTPIPTANSRVGEVIQVHSMNIESTPYTSCASMQAVIKRMQLSYPGFRDVIFVHNPSETDPSYTVRVYGTQQFTQSHAVFHEVKEVIRIETEEAARRVAADSATKLSTTKKAAPSTAPAVTPSPATFDMTNLAAMITAEVTAQVQQAMGNQVVTAPSPSASFDINAFVQQKVTEQMELLRLTHSLTAANSNLPQSAAVDHGVSSFNHSPTLEPGIVQTSIDADGEMVFEMVNPGEGESANSQLMSPAGEIVTPVIVDKSAMFRSSIKAVPIPPKPISFDAMVADSGDLPPVSNSRRLVMTKIVPSHAIGLIRGEGDSKIDTLRNIVGIHSITIQPSSITLNAYEIHIAASSQPSLDAVTRELERLMKVANKRLVRQ